MALVRVELKYPIPPGLIFSMVESLILFAIQFFKKFSYVNEKWKKILKIVPWYQNGRDVCSMEASNAIVFKRSVGWWQEGRIRSYSLQLVREDMLWDSCQPIQIWQPVSAYLDLQKSVLLFLAVCLSIMTVGRWMGKCLAIMCLTVMIHMWLEVWPQETERLQGSHDLFLMSSFSIFIWINF